MYSLYRGSTNLHNEATKSQKKRDNDDESSLLPTFLGFSVFSSVSHPGTLQKLVTKYQATEVIQESLLHANVIGQQEVKKCVQDRWIVAVSVSVSVFCPLLHPSMCEAYCRWGDEWVVESTAVTHFQCRLMEAFTSPGIDTR